jgi:hypothetical protein
MLAQGTPLHVVSEILRKASMAIIKTCTETLADDDKHAA